MAEGTVVQTNGAPVIPPVSVVPLTIGNPAATVAFPELNLATTPLPFRNDPLHAGITQALLNGPNSLLAADIARHQAQGFTTASTTVLGVATTPQGGTESIPFLTAAISADIAQMHATFWVEEWSKGSRHFLALQYSQTVLLNVDARPYVALEDGCARRTVLNSAHLCLGA